MNIIYGLIVFLILAITALVLNEEIKINPMLNNVVTRAVILIGVVYTGSIKDYPMAVLLSILFVVLTNEYLDNSKSTYKENFDGENENESEAPEPINMSLDLTDASDVQKCLAKCVSFDENPQNCNQYCDNNCFLTCSTNIKNMSWGDCLDQCQ